MKAIRFRSNVSVMPFFVTIVILVACGLYYLRHNAIQQEYFRDRNLRQLKLVGEQLASRLNNIKRLLRNTPRGDASDRTYQPRTYLENLHFRHVDNALNDLPEGVARKMKEGSKSATVIFLQERDDTTWLQFGDVDAGRKNDWQEIAARMDIREVIRPLIVENVFDEFVLLGPAGRVVYQKGGIDVHITCIDSLGDVNGNRLGAESFRNVSGVVNPVFAEKEYKLFFQPVSLPIMEQDSLALGSECDVVWTVCGLVLSDRFNRETRELSYTLLIFAVMLILLVSLSWPLLKLWFMGRHDYATRADLYLIILALMMGSGLLTFIVVDAIWVQGGFRSAIDEQLQEYADSVDRNLTTELGDALGQLREYIALGAKNDTGATVNLLKADSNRRPSRYKHFDFVYWVDANGNQTMKWSTKQFVTQTINVAERKYFTDVKQGRLLHVSYPGQGDYDFAIEPHYSWTSGIFRVAISMRDTVMGQRFLVGMDMKALSVAQTVNLPGFGLGIIDDAGNVLFHSHPERALRENLFDELDPDNEVRSLVFARSNGHVDARYWGVDHRLFVKPMKGMPWTIVVFREKTALWTMNMQILTGALSLFGLYLLLPVLLILFLSRRKNDTDTWIWPSEQQTSTYRQLTVVFVFTAIVQFAVQMMDDHLLHALGSILVLSILVVVLTYTRLTKSFSHWFDQASKQGRMLLAARIPCLGIGALSLLWIMNSRETAEHWTGVVPHVVFDLCLFGIGAAFLVKPFGSRMYNPITPSKYRTNYVTAHLTFIVLASVLPALIFFRISYNVQAELFVKHAQLQLGRGLQEAAMRSDKSLSEVDRKSVYAGYFFKTDWKKERRDLERHITEDGGRNVLFKSLIAPYNESSLEMRNLLAASSVDSSLVWSSNDSVLIMGFRYPGATQGFTLTSHLPVFSDMGFFSPLGTLLQLALLGVLLLLFIVVWDISKKLFLIKLREPRRADLFAVLQQPLTSSLFLTNVPIDRIAKALAGRAHVIDLAKGHWDSIWSGLDQIVGLPPDKVIVVHHCEDRMHESAANRKKVKLLEALMIVHRKNVIITSGVDPLLEFNLTSATDPRTEGTAISDLRTRWRTILDMCAKPLIGGVTADIPNLHGEEMQSSGPYCRRVWHACSEDERRVLVHVARGRFVSPKSQDVVKTLLAQGFLERKPVLKVANKQFGRFLDADEREEEVERYKIGRVASGWNAWKLPLMMLLVAGAMFLFITQQDVLNWTMAFVSAASALLPAIFRLFGMLTTGKGVEEGTN